MQTENEQSIPNRKIIHIDMDAFYAAVEIRANPDLKGKPVIVGGKPDSRGVVSTCSYEARKYGIHSAMPCSQAYRLCPHAIFLPPDFSKYKAVSKQIREIFLQYTDLVEPLSLDEAYLDVTKNIPYATEIAREIKEKIVQKTGLTASAGVSFNKFLAKVASDYNKPDGLTVITPKNADQFINKLPIRKFFGVGKVTEQKMIKLGIKTGWDLKQKNQQFLLDNFGKAGNYFYQTANCLDNRTVTPHRIRKSVGMERTFARDIDDKKIMHEYLKKFAGEISTWLKKNRKKGKTITLKVKYHDFLQTTRSITLSYYCHEAPTILHNALILLNKTEAGKTKIRLLGITLSNLIEEIS